LSRGTIAGIVAGSVIGGLLLISLTWFYLKRRKGAQDSQLVKDGNVVEGSESDQDRNRVKDIGGRNATK
jgi:hypothetical protein